VDERRDPEDLRVAVVVLRSLRGWDQQKLADMLGMSGSSISRYESGETVPPDRVWEQILAVVGLPAPQTDRLFAWLRASRAALANPGSLQNQLDVLAYQFTDHMFEVFRQAAAVIVSDPQGTGGGALEPKN
jgi:transcriptional regulator with XRE-family HTH domain